MRDVYGAYGNDRIPKWRTNEANKWSIIDNNNVPSPDADVSCFSVAQHCSELAYGLPSPLFSKTDKNAEEAFRVLNVVMFDSPLQIKKATQI